MIKRRIIVLLLLPLLLFGFNIYAAQPVQVFVSILPLKYFVKRIGADKVKVRVMVLPGHSPETYAPTPQQMAALHHTQIYYRVGVPFEKAWLAKIKKLNPKLQIVDLRKGIKLQKLANSEDPHIWNDPILVVKMVNLIARSLIAIDKVNKKVYQHNYRLFIEDLQQLNTEITLKLRDIQNRILLVYHPAWGYFANRYNLQQVAIEKEGKEAGPKDLSKIIQLAKKNKIKAIFVEPQFSKAQANMVAQTIGAKIVVLNPLPENYLDNMRQVATKIAFYLSK